MATRPPFLTVTLYSCLIGLATAFVDGVNIRPATAIGTVVFALVAHAAINVLNDYYDALNGTDAKNLERIFPFTGGSRFIQNRVLTARETVAFGFGLMAVVIAAGKWHWVVRLGASRARWGYGQRGLLAYGWLTIAVITGKLPWLALIVLLPVFLSRRAAQDLFKYADDPAKLVGAIKLMIAAASLHGLLIAVSLVVARWFGQCVQ